MRGRRSGGFEGGDLVGGWDCLSVWKKRGFGVWWSCMEPSVCDLECIREFGDKGAVSAFAESEGLKCIRSQSNTKMFPAVIHVVVSSVLH